MKKRLILICIILVFGIVAVYADVTYKPFYNGSFKISAYKVGVTTGNTNRPSELIDIRITDPNSNEVQIVNNLTPKTETPYLDVPLSARTNYYVAFLWSMYGNYYLSLRLSFSFFPMVLFNENQPDYSNCIPYKVRLIHTATKIGSNEIDINKSSTLRNPIKEDYSGYYFYYADSISGDISINNSSVTPKSITDASTSGVSLVVNYNMSPNSRVEEWTETEEDGATTIQKESVSYNDTLCNYWARSGRAEILLEVPSGILDDRYYAFVRLEISKE